MRIPLFGLGVQSRSRVVTSAKAVNLYFEIRPEGEKSRVVAYGTPGLDLFSDAGDTPWRGLIPVETTDYLYGVHRGVLYQVDNAGVRVSRGTLNTTTGRVSMEHNGTVLVIADGTDLYTYNTVSTAFAVVADPDLIANPATVTWLDQYFVVANGTEFQISEDGTNWDALEVAVPESNPDGIVRVFADHGELSLFGDISIEPWTNSGATDFPFTPLKSSNAEWGCAARWSVVKYNDSVAFLGKSRMGQVSVCVMQGYVPKVISTPDIDQIINGYGGVSDASAFSYLLGGHPMLQINFPSAGYSWLYDASSGHWSSVKSADINRHRAEIGVQYLSRTVVSDYENGRLYRLNADTYTDNGETIERDITSENVAMPDLERFPAHRLRVDMETGVGLATGQGSNPQVALKVSRDGGRSWGNIVFGSIGEIGEYRTIVEWRRLGMARTFTFNLRITDPVKVALVSASLNPAD